MNGNSLKECFMSTALIRRENKAISFLRDGVIETEISYLQLDRDSNRLANTFLDFGIEKGDRVILFIEKSLFFVIAHVALQKVGAISVPLNPGFKKSEMSYFIKDADAKLILSESYQELMVRDIDPGQKTILIHTDRPYQDLDFFRSASDEIPPQVEIREDDPGIIMYTSGTTGKPKGAILTQNNLAHNARNVIRTWEIMENDVLCHVLPLYHIHGLCFALHTALIAGAHVLMLDSFSPEKVIEVLSRKEGKYPCTLFMAVPTMYGKLMDCLGDSRLQFGHIRLWTSGSAPLLPEDFVKVKEVFGKEPVEREGMSETGINFTNPVRGVRKPGSIGLPLPRLAVRIVDPNTFQDVRPGQTGEIWLKGPAVTPGYWKKPEETAKTFQNGWFRTGDLGKIDEDGYYHLTDRIKQIIISGGENISPKEIESVINQIGDVVESSVVGIPDEKWGERVVAAVVTRSGSSLNSGDVHAYCKQRLHNWKCPKRVILVDELPRNRMGKILKDKVKELFI